MESAVASREQSASSRWIAAAVCAVAGVAVWQFFGNATRGYVQTDSMFWWWISQWLDPQAETEHGWLVLGISGWLLWRNLKEGSGFRVSGSGFRVGDSESVWPAAVAMVAGLALNLAGFVAQQTRVGIVGFLLFAWGVLRLGGGPRWGRAAAFPLGFLLFAVPVNVLDTAGFWLRVGVVDASTALARGAGIALVRNGTQLFAPDGHYQYDVVAACSGVRSLVALSALALLIGYLNFRTWWRRGLMLALCWPLAFLGNVARMMAIIFAAQAGGQAWGERAHDVMGYGVFVIVLGGVWLASEALRRWWPEQIIPDTGSRKPDTGGRWRTVAVGVVVGLAVGEMFFLAHLGSLEARGRVGVVLTADGKDPVDLPLFVGTEWVGRRAEVTAVEREVLPPDTGFSRRNYIEVASGRHAVFVSVVLSGRDRTSIHRPEVCLVGQGWTIRGAGSHVFNGGVPATLLRTTRTEARGGNPVPALVAYWFVNGDRVVASHWERFMWDAWNRLRHGRADRWAYVLVQADAGDGEAAALARMQAVLAGVLPGLQLRR
ncbi:MAG: EpsI family protein [Verrucomicrobia bacterium]|nr:EpsI family protein [Verrucomicrobiota bacterium]